MPATIVDALRDAQSQTDRGYTFLDGRMEPTYYPFQSLVAEVEKRGRQLMARGLKKGDRVGLVIPESEDFVLTFLGAIMAGLVPVPMYPPLALGRLDSYLESATRILRAAHADTLVTTKKVSPILWSLLEKVDTLDDILLVSKLKDTRPSTKPLAEVRPEDTCFLQFTSGSTSDPKGVMVTHANLIANASAIMFDGLKSRDGDVGVSWLPLYHDMGLIGFVISPMVAKIPAVFIPTMSFVKRPTVWMETINKYRGTITFAPNFAFALAAKRASKQPRDGFDLSCLRVVGCGAEPINPATMRTFAEAFRSAGLNEDAVMPSYGMAEATLAMSFEPLDEPLKTITIDKERYEAEHRAFPADEGLELVSCGRTFPGHGIAAMDDDGKILGDGEVGELVFSGPSVTAGYFENEEATRQTIQDGWLRTGDLGFISEGRVYVSGRKKDVIILNGRNYYPQSIEWEVEQLKSVRKGNVVAFAVTGDNTERLVIVAESRTKNPDALKESIASVVKSTLGLIVSDVILVDAGTLPKTSSGKLQRRRTKQQHASGQLGLEGNRTQGKNATRAHLARHMTVSFFARIRHRIRKMRLLPGAAFSSRVSRRAERRTRI